MVLVVQELEDLHLAEKVLTTMDPHASPDGRLAPQAPRGTLLASRPDINQSKELEENIFR